MKYLVRLDDEEALDPRSVGFKFSSLARATRAGFEVPFAVAVSTRAHRHRRETGRFPDPLRDELSQLARELDLEGGISVRSSATLEDLDGQSFAGVYETHLDVKGESKAIESIERCWASATGVVARSYLRQTGAADETPEMSVVLQTMVRPVFAGVAFSSNPMSPRSGEVVIEAVRGLGDSLVSGSVTPSRAFVGAESKVRRDTGGQDTVEATEWLNDDQYAAVAALARACEAAADGTPQDVEWALDAHDKVWLLQTRPITTVRGPQLEAPSGTWTRGIAVDLWADRLTPFVAEAMIRNAPRYDFSRYAAFIGTPAVQPTLGTIDGYLYVNCDSLKEVLRSIPRPLRTCDLRALFPPGFDIDSVAPSPAWKLALIGLRSALLGIVVPQANPLLCEFLSRRGLKVLDRRLDEIDSMPAGSAAERLDRVRAATECLAQLQIRNQWPYLYATVFTLALRWFAVDRFGLKHGDFLQLISGRGENITNEVERETRDLAAMVREDPDLLARLRREPAERLVRALPMPFRAAFERFLERYGFRSRHRTIHVPRWREAPTEVLGMIRTLAAQAGDPRPERAPDPDALEEEIRARLATSQRWIVRLLHGRSRRFLDLREDLRFFLDKILFVIRRSLLALGEQTGLGDSVFFLTVDELDQTVAGAVTMATLEEMVAERRQRFGQVGSPPSFVVDGRAVEALAAGGELLSGIGTSPGRASGRARIVEDPTRSELSEGDILVARNTDPGWTPVLSIAGGVVVEEGGLLNHCSIVARELGIPAVVGVRDAIRLIPDGVEITIDGDLGVVQLVEADS